MKKILAALTASILVLFASTAASAGDDEREVEARSDLSGDLENPAVASDMTGEFRVEIEDGEGEFRLKVRDNSGTIVAAHIHCAGPGANGPVGVDLEIGTFTDEKGEVARGDLPNPNPAGPCGWSSLDDVADAISAGEAYVNVHTLANRGGEVRGNLSPR